MQRIISCFVRLKVKMNMLFIRNKGISTIKVHYMRIINKLLPINSCLNKSKYSHLIGLDFWKYLTLTGAVKNIPRTIIPIATVICKNLFAFSIRNQCKLSNKL